MNELKTYLNGRKCGFAAIVDTTSPNKDGEHFRKYLVPGSAAVFYVVLDSAVFPNPFGALVGIDRKTNRAQWNCVIPLSITRQTISKVIDLREPETAQWFTHHFTRLTNTITGFPVFQLAGPLDRFDRLLPTLMAQDLGGGPGVHVLAGLWLRRLGVDALIFPSAGAM